MADPEQLRILNFYGPQTWNNWRQKTARTTVIDLSGADLLVTDLHEANLRAGIQVDHVWARTAPAGHEGAVYLTITDGGAPDTLTGVTTSVATEAAVHQSIEDHGVMKMRPVGPLPIEPGKPVKLAPGGYHIMLSGRCESD